MEITATQFKARCLALLDEVAESGTELTITKRGKPVAVVSAPETKGSLQGSVEQLVSDDGFVEPVGVGWDADA